LKLSTTHPLAGQHQHARGIRYIVTAAGRMIDRILPGARGAAFQGDELLLQNRIIEQRNRARIDQRQNFPIRSLMRSAGSYVMPLTRKRSAASHSN
jgi:hypothetical protein